MNNTHDEIKNLLKASRNMLSKPINEEQVKNIRQKYSLLTEEEYETGSSVVDKINVTKSVDDRIDSDVKSKKDKTQSYRISGGILVLHGKEQSELELTTDEKIAFQETMDEFVAEVSDLVDFNKLNVYTNNVEWSGKIIDFDIDFFFSIGEENGMYINGEMIKTDESFLELLTKLKTFYQKFKSKWAKVLASRKKTKKEDEE
jgi:hypothetical protein